FSLRASFPLVLTTVRAPPTLHSFPTRRSSDLHRAREYERVHGRSQRGICEGDPGAGEPCFRSIDGSDRSVGPRLGSVVVRGRDEDRKSTRLNSSHQIISYAVFCLKKKTKRSQD